MKDLEDQMRAHRVRCAGWIECVEDPLQRDGLFHVLHCTQCEWFSSLFFITTADAALFNARSSVQPTALRAEVLQR